MAMRVRSREVRRPLRDISPCLRLPRITSFTYRAQPAAMAHVSQSSPAHGKGTLGLSVVV